jgi:hypothetical protein
MLTFVVAGAFSHFSDISLFVLRNPGFLARNRLVVYDGVDDCAWNGGRINRDVPFDRAKADFYHSRGVGVALTFSNYRINLDDPVGNRLLEELHREGNSVILIDEGLRRHVRRNFPLYTLRHSITGMGMISVPMSDLDVRRYRELEEAYDVIVPRSEHIFDPRFPLLNVPQYEVMTNDTCVYNCRHYHDHFRAIAKQNHVRRPWETLGHDHCFSVEECWLPGFDPDVGCRRDIERYGRDYGMDITREQFGRLVAMGVRNFKVSGRELGRAELLREVENYLGYAR